MSCFSFSDRVSIPDRRSLPVLLSAPNRFSSSLMALLRWLPSMTKITARFFNRSRELSLTSMAPPFLSSIELRNLPSGPDSLRHSKPAYENVHRRRTHQPLGQCRPISPNRKDHASRSPSKLPGSGITKPGLAQSVNGRDELAPYSTPPRNHPYVIDPYGN